MNAATIAKAVMRLAQTRPPSPEEDIGTCQEIFRYEGFVGASAEKKREIMLQSSLRKYEEELAYPWDHYFGVDLTPLLIGRSALDLGCFNGGRSVAWCERYRLAHLVGFDVEPGFIEAARQFAALKDVRASFEIARGEKLPLADSAVDAVLSFDVFEHVQNVSETLAECYRVLKPGGRLFVVFPGYYQPLEHHLAMVTRMPGLHYLFSGATLARAYYDILQERGSDARWYARGSPHLASWEKGNTINGTTLRSFKKCIAKYAWKRVTHVQLPIGSVGRNASKKSRYQLLARVARPLARAPGLREIFLHRITYILQK